MNAKIKDADPVVYQLGLDGRKRRVGFGFNADEAFTTMTGWFKSGRPRKESAGWIVAVNNNPRRIEANIFWAQAGNGSENLLVVGTRPSREMAGPQLFFEKEANGPVKSSRINLGWRDPNAHWGRLNYLVSSEHVLCALDAFTRRTSYKLEFVEKSRKPASSADRVRSFKRFGLRPGAEILDVIFVIGGSVFVDKVARVT